MTPQLITTTVIAALMLAGNPPAAPSSVSPEAGLDDDPSSAADLERAQRKFYNGRYLEAEELTAQMCSRDAASLAACELRSSTLLFEMKRAVGRAPDKQAAWKACERCPELMSAFRATTLLGQQVARARLVAEPGDQSTRFFLGKLDLNYVWLQLGVLGHKTGWDEYWEARRLLDEVLKANPQNTRAQVARAWIDYIVDTQMPRLTKWILGGGNKKRGLRTVAAAAVADEAPFIRAEAGFALWDMQVREGNVAEAITTARGLSRDFPENEELSRFLDGQGARALN